ncbi:MAG: FHA domain-containing protein [Deltaproteobacteria bacterium]|nr:FHA domain-containing protein [Deltaproteobacteria bacterium]
MSYLDTGEGSAPEFSLTITEGDGKGEKFEFDRVEISVGRNPENDMVLSSSKVSRCHFNIRYAGTKYIIRDEGSSNGTLVNGKPIKKALLSNGDKIRVGPFVLLFGTGQQTPEGDLYGSKSDTNRTPTGARTLPPGGVGSVRGAKPLARAGERPGRIPGRVAKIEPIRRRRVSGRIRVVVERAGVFFGPLKQWLDRQDKLTRMLFYSTAGAIGFLLLVLLVIVFVQSIGEEENLSARVYEAPLSGPLGYCDEDRSHPDELRIRFKYGSGRATLEYSVYNVTSGGEIKIKVNGVDVSEAPLSPGKWTEGIRMVIPKTHLLENADNLLVFDNTFNPPKRREWAVGDIKVTEEPLPKGNIRKAREYMERARKRYQSRKIGFENLYRAWEYFRLARDYMENLENKPDLYQEADTMVETCRRELEEEYSGGMFRIHRALEYDNLDEARREAERLLKFFPEPDDRRHREIKQLLEQLNE